MQDPGTGEYEGMIRVGPIPRCRSREVLQAMRDLGLRIARAEGVQIGMKTTPEGFTLSASGPGVQAYLLDEDHGQASISSLEALAERILQNGTGFPISGRHQVDEGKLVTFEARIEVRNREAKGRSRTILHAENATPIVLSEDKE